VIETKYADPKKGQKMKRLEQEIRQEERERKKIDKLDTAEKMETMAEDRMSKALMKAGGEKVRDNIGKLNKTKKNLEKKKERNREKWVKRESAKNDKGVTRQEERKENIQKFRGKAPLKKRTGFEGKRGDGVINKDKDI